MLFPDHLDIPREVRRIAETLEAAGFDTWCVGGAVRDNLLGEVNNDFDLATAARPEDVQRLFTRTIPIGVDHGTVAVLDRHRKPHEVTTFRRDVKTDGRHAVVEFGASIDEDLARRDFTINAIAYHPLESEWRDPYDGHRDLERGVLRSVGDPSQRFREDYLRILRALRFAARFGFTIEDATWEAAKANAEDLRRLSAERVRDEWLKGLETARRPSELVRLWGEVGAIETWLPELQKEWEKGERGKGKGDAVRGAQGAVDRLPRDPVLITVFLSGDRVGTGARSPAVRTRSRCGVGWRASVRRRMTSLPSPPLRAVTRCSRLPWRTFGLLEHLWSWANSPSTATLCATWDWPKAHCWAASCDSFWKTCS
jgi:hypothetical protein